MMKSARFARLSYRSALAHFELGNSRTAVVDLGGGSLELALSYDGIVDRLMSLPLGAVRLTERFLSDGDGPKRLAKLRRHVAEVIRGSVPVRPWRGARQLRHRQYGDRGGDSQRRNECGAKLVWRRNQCKFVCR